MSNSDYADSPAFGSNKVAVADDEAIAPADYREPKQMTRMEEPQSPMELLLQKTKLRLMNTEHGPDSQEKKLLEKHLEKLFEKLLEHTKKRGHF